MAQKVLDLTGNLGLTDRFWGDRHRTASQPNLRYDASDGEMAEGIYNPLMYKGYLAPSNNSLLTMTVPTITTPFTCGFIEAGFRTMGFGSTDDKIYSADYSFVDSTITYTYSELDAVKFEDSGDHGNDIRDFEIYLVNEQKKLFYISGADVGITEENDFDPDDTTWLSVTAAGGTTLHSTDGLGAFMRVADNGFMYIFDDHAVHKIDGNSTGGTNGTATMDVLIFPDSLFTISDAVDNRGLMYIGLNYVGFQQLYNTKNNKYIFDIPYCGVYIWDRLSTAVRMRDYIRIPGIKAISRLWVHTDGVIHAMTIGANNLTQIRRFTGNQFELVRELPKNAKISVHDGLTVAEGLTVWAGDDGYVYGYDFKGNRGVIYRLLQYTTSTLDSGGGTVLLYAGADSFDATTANTTDERPSLYIAYKESGTNAKIKRWFFYATGTLSDGNGASGQDYFADLPIVANIGNVYSPVYYLPYLSDIKNLVIYCAPGTTSDSTTIATIKIYFNQSTTASMTKVVTKKEAAQGYVPIDINKSYVNAIQIEIEWDTSLVMGTDDFLPSIGVLTYEATNTHTSSIV
jgi:hypothetical protein